MTNYNKKILKKYFTWCNGSNQHKAVWKKTSTEGAVKFSFIFEQKPCVNKTSITLQIWESSQMFWDYTVFSLDTTGITAHWLQGVWSLPNTSGLRSWDGESEISSVHVPSALSPQQWTVMNSQFLKPSLELSNNLEDRRNRGHRFRECEENKVITSKCSLFTEKIPQKDLNLLNNGWNKEGNISSKLKWYSMRETQKQPTEPYKYIIHIYITIQIFLKQTTIFTSISDADILEPLQPTAPKLLCIKQQKSNNKINA